ncbi:MAG: rod shape-determining protein MreC [Candidatus Cyclonatronum sp.]|uniref:rod shape-determining protein MreC n=1 Tax=Cyclonatronum sp. TaxID=3024185 RepID=UPI0025B89F37|nr:rod shape-determining protein MreC [Cyclonatronum sp.]MCC5934213.1 rod shape-determining protein MreC [Balneolales bacterium]MCH8487028.1 rod shape-determining protein MreC [Cyclonatronum sp.]
MRIRFTKIGDIRDQLISAALILVALFMMVARQDNAFQNVRKASITLVSYVEAPLSNVRVYRSALRTNAALEQNTILLQDEISRLRSLRDENEVLRALLNFRDTSEFDMQPVRIVAKNLTGINNNIIVNAGSDQGLVIGMPVVNHEGLIGTITIVASGHAQVLPLFNRQFRASVRLEESRAFGIISWESDNLSELVINFVPQTISVQAGMRVYTSGLSNKLPPNIPVGMVIRAEPEPGRETQRIYVAPYVNFSTLAEGHVLLYTVEEEILELEQEWQEIFE